MGKVAVKLANPDNRLHKDDGTPFTPYEVHVVDETERIKKCIEINALEKVPGHPIPEESTKPSKTEKVDDDKKK